MNAKIEKMRQKQAGQLPQGKPPEKAEAPKVEQPKAKAKPQSRWAKRDAQQNGRLPDGSRFEAQYDAAKTQWTGSLTMLVGGEAKTFTATCSGVFKLMSTLDRLYRKFLDSIPAREG